MHILHAKGVVAEVADEARRRGFAEKDLFMPAHSSRWIHRGIPTNPTCQTYLQPGTSLEFYVRSRLTQPSFSLPWLSIQPIDSHK